MTKLTLFGVFYIKLGVFLKEMYEYRNRQKSHGGGPFEWSGGDANQLIFDFAKLRSYCDCFLLSRRVEKLTGGTGKSL